VDAHAAAVEAFSSLFSLPDDDKMVEGAEVERLARQYALAHMLADLWRSLVTLPRTMWDCTAALAKAGAPQV
jgi:hypothetical protein